MKKKTLLSLLLFASMATGLGTAATEQAPTQKESAETVETVGDSGHALAIRALGQMAAYLRSLDRYHVMGRVSRETVLEDGQKLQFDKEVSLLVAKPNRMYMETTTAYGTRRFYYDGKQFTVYLPGLRFYATFDAPDTLLETILEAQEKHGLEFPLADLFFWGTEYGDFGVIEDAMLVGVGRVDGVTCNHFAFRQKEVDWQICIKRGGNPLPLKLVITTKTQPELPQYVATLKWDTAPVLAGRNFSFQPGKDDVRIRFADRIPSAGKDAEGDEK